MLFLSPFFVADISKAHKGIAKAAVWMYMETKEHIVRLREAYVHVSTGSSGNRIEPEKRGPGRGEGGGVDGSAK